MKRLFTIALIISGAFMMVSCQGPDSQELSESQIAQIKAEVEKAANEHINSKDAPTALSHYTDDAIAVSNDKLYPSFESFAEDVRSYYNISKEVNLAAWDRVHIHVINADTALFTGEFRYSFTSINNNKRDLQGVCTLLYVRRNGIWKVCARHESF